MSGVTSRPNQNYHGVDVMRRRIGTLLTASVISLASAVPAVAQGSAPIKLGLIDIYSGGFTFIADTIRTGFEIALTEANAAGGLDGRKFELVTADMGTQVEKAVTEARRMMLEQGIGYVTVGIHSGAAVAVGDLAKEHQKLVIGGFATTRRLTGEAGHDFVGRANLSTVEIGRVMAEHLKSRPDIKTVATIAPDYEFGQQFTGDFVDALKQARPDIKIVRQEWPKFGAADFAPHVTALQAQPVDLIVSGLFGADSINFLKAARDFGLFEGSTGLFIHGLDLTKPSAMKDTLPKNTMSTVWYPFYAIDSAKSKAFAAEVEKRMGTYATGSAPVGYVAGKMITAAIVKAKSADPKAVVKAMGGIEFEGPTGIVKVRACDHMALYNFYVGKVSWDKSLPDGIGLTDVKAYHTENLARSCEDVAKARAAK
jgi:branched-chain amino acid transport system substrate-binding protein